MKLLILNVRSFYVDILIVGCHLIIMYQLFAKKSRRKVCALARVTLDMSLSKNRNHMYA